MKILQDTLREEFGKRTIADTELPKYFTTSLKPDNEITPLSKGVFSIFHHLLAK